MKQSILLSIIFICLISTFKVYSQSPGKINFQSILRNTTGEIVSNKAVSIRMSIIRGTINGTSVYVETHTKTTDISGLISIKLGTGVVINGIFGDIEWGSASHFIQLEVDFNGGTNYVVIGTQELISVPYALYANKTDTSVLNLTSRFSTKLNISDTASLSNRINAKAILSDSSLLNLTSRFSTKLNGTDTVSMSNRIDAKANKSDTSLLNLTSRFSTKLNVSDTASLSNRINTKLNVTDTASLSNRINTKLNVTDTASLSNRINTKLNETDTVLLSNRINTKLNVTDTAILSNRINTKLNVTDTASLSNRIDIRLIGMDTVSLSNRINTKLNVTDTVLLSNRIDTKLNVTDTVLLSNRINTKSNITDTVLLSNRINTKLNVTDTVSLSNRIETKLNVTDTASLSNRINTKLNGADTASLSNRINTKLNVTDTVLLSNRINTKLNITDTASLSNRINAKLNITDTVLLSNRINTKLNITDTVLLSNRINTKLNITDTASLSNRINTKLNVTDTALLSNRINTKLNITDTVSLSNRINTKLNVTDTAILSNRINTKLNETDVATLLNPYFKKVDTTTLNLTNRFNAKVNVTDFPQGTATGNILIWNNGHWVNLAPGSSGQSLIISSSGIPTWGCIITNTAGTASSTPTLNAYSALTPITHSTSGATGIGTATGLPAGVSASWTANTITISGTPSSAGSFTYTIPLTGGCGSINATGSITVNALAATLTTTSIGSITATDASSGGNITFDGGGITARGVVWSTSTGPTVSLSTKTTDGTGTGTFTSTISGLTASTSYYVRAYATNAAGTSYGNEITFTTCTLNTAGSPSSSPSLVVNTSLTPITISTTGATGIGNGTGLPAGITASWSSNVITISGTPTASGSFTYIIPLTGGCGSVNATGTITVIPPFMCGTETVSDIDGNTYNTVVIGTSSAQCWMTVNLKTSRYRNGDLIPIVTGNSDWSGLRTGGRSWYNNDSTTYENPYGNLYNWYAVADSRGLCPEGWDVPSLDEWNTLISSLGGTNVASGKMKSTGTDYWNNPNAASNESNFSALPGGYRVHDGSFLQINQSAWFWTSSVNGSFAYYQYLWHSQENIRLLSHVRYHGGSVRCLKD